MHKPIKKILVISLLSFLVFGGLYLFLGLISFDRGRSDDCPFLNAVSKHGKNTPVILKEYARQGEDVNKANSEGVTAIHIAATISPDLVTTLLDLGGDINIQDTSGNTPLHYAVGNCNILTTQVLISRGADTSIKDHLGKRASDYIYDDRCSSQKNKILEAFQRN